MSPTAADGSLLLVARAAVVQRGDIVVAEVPAGWASATTPERIIKRVVGVAGDRVSCCDPDSGMLVVNGHPVTEPYLAARGSASDIGFDIVVPEGHVWLLGDNRAVSIDSRRHLWDGRSGAVPASAIVGVVWTRMP